MKAHNFTSRYSGQLTFVGVAIFLASLVAVLAVIGFKAYAEAEKQTGRYRIYKSLQQDAGMADSLSGIYSSVLVHMEKIRRALPDQNQASFVLNVLVAEARRLELGIASINALDEVILAGYKEIPLEVNLAGGFANLIRYLQSLETQGMLLQVRKLTIESEAMNKARIKGKLELSVFVPGEAGHSVGSTAPVAPTVFNNTASNP